MTSDTASATGARVNRWSVPFLGFGTFAVGTCEFVLAGVLPELSRAFGTSVATAGQVVTVFGLTVVVLTPVMATFSARWQRRTVLLIAMGLYFLGGVGTALAPSFEAVLGSQVVAAAGAGLFIPTAAVTATALVEPERRGRAIAIVTTGLTAATALGAPIGTAIGDLLGWRATMWFVAALAVVAVLGLLALVPGRISAPAAEGLRDRLRPLTDRRVIALLATTLVAFLAVYMLYTYISVVFAPATGGSGVQLAILMFALGGAGTVGNFAAGSLADRFGGRRVVGLALVALAVVLVLVPLTTGTLGLAIVLAVLYGASAFAITTPQQHRLITLDPDSASVLVSLNASILYLAIALSGVVGAAGLAVVGANNLPFAAAAVAIVALALSELTHRLTRGRAATAAAHPDGSAD